VCHNLNNGVLEELSLITYLVRRPISNLTIQAPWMPPKSTALSPSIKRPQRVGVLGLTSFYNIADGNLAV
jgi:hypothetical protein